MELENAVLTKSIVIVGVCVLFLLMTGTMSAVAQMHDEESILEPPFAHNAIYVELLGQGLLYSINYDFRFSDHVSLRAGFSSWSIPAVPFFPSSDLSFTGFPVMLNYLSGTGDSHLELGIGFIPATASVSGTFLGENLSGGSTLIIGTGTIGFRLQPREGGFVFRVGFTPFITSDGIKPSIGLSLGSAF